MSSNVQESSIEKVKALPPEEQEMGLRYVESLEQSREQPLKTIWEEIREITADVPHEVWETTSEGRLIQPRSLFIRGAEETFAENTGRKPEPAKQGKIAS